jgi:hypothetical protein
MVGQPGKGETKKLTDAAEYWFSGGVKDETPDDAAALGVIFPDEAVQSGDFEVWPENWPAVEMWLRIQTQWRTSVSGIVGLDYSVLPWLFTMYEVSTPRDLLEDLQTMEASVLVLMSKEA